MSSYTWILCAVLAAVGLVIEAAADSSDEPTVGETLDSRLKSMEQSMTHISRQLMLQQLFVEERIRSEGRSGLKTTRLVRHGTKTYHANDFNGKRVAAIHDHANHIRTVGMGEFIAVLNGVEFRTRHNDYQLVMPATVPDDQTGINQTIYDAVDNIPFPDVPPDVTDKLTVEEQIAEMKEYFKAFSQQNETHRDYQKYFKPLLCYLEGGWTNSDENTIDESFSSDRHHLDAESWLDLQEKVRYSSYTGRKDRFENVAYLPTTIMKVIDGTPILAQWNYRILCHPLNNYLSTDRFVLVDDLNVRMANKQTLDEYRSSRSARFELPPKDEDSWSDGFYQYDLLDELMYEIPGKNGYKATIYDDGVTGSRAKMMNDKDKFLNAAYYNRWFTGDKDAMGSNFQHRGFHDDSLFVAATTQEKIAPIEAKYCNQKGKNCVYGHQRFTYAVPLEVVYMTPLMSWNPYNIEYKADENPKDIGDGKSEANAMPFVSKETYNRTPKEFLQKNEASGDPADTSNGFMWVKDDKGVPQAVVSSGVRNLMPLIEGVDGRLRLRYPIMPIHQEGSVFWKKIDALQDKLVESAGISLE